MLTYSDPVSLSAAQTVELLAFAGATVRAAGKATLPFFRADVAVKNKRTDGSFDPVTQADHAAETLIREAIERTYPNHGILGEEYGQAAGNGLTWVIDPIDGTRAFMSGFLHWGVLLGLFDGQRPVLGVMYQPFTDELFSGDRAASRYEQGAKVRDMRVSSTTQLSDAVMATTSPKYFAQFDALAGFRRLEEAAKLSRYGGDCYIYAMLAMGYVDIALDAGLNPYDIQALIPIIEGAGGVVSTADGGDASMGGLVVAAATPQLHEAALRELQGGA